MKRVLYIGLLLLVGLLTLEGCIKEDNPVVAETRNISMTMNVDTRAGGSDINVDIESAINTLRVYAFYGERKVGYFYGNDKNLVVDGGKLSFSMDLDIPTMSFLEEPISFYLVANEETVSVYNSPAWSPDMTRMQLENYCFRELNNPRTALPMVTVKDVMINPNDIKESEVHSEHWMWTGGPIEFELERSVAKLGMYFAAKEPDIDLEVMQVEILPSGLQDYSYMFAPGHESENLKNVPHSWQYGFSLINGGAVSIDKVVTDDEYNSYTPEDKKNPEKVLATYSEDYHLGLWVTGKKVANSWAHPDENSSVYELKAYVENILKRLGLDLHNLVVGNLTDDIFATALSVHTKGGKRLASFGVVTKKLLKAFDIDNEVYYADLNWKELMKAIRSVKISYKEISKFPAVKRDLALLLDKNVQFAEIEKIAYDTEKKLLKEVELFDVYEGKNIEAGKKSYAVSFLLQDETQTLNDKMIDKIMSKLVKNLEDKLGAKLR